jgi:glycosyltransferase involved in cell wall biosynthesis
VKLLVLAHKPPPHHGQSYMVQLLLDALNTDGRKGEGGSSHTETHDGDPVIECYHVDARYSSSDEDLGQARWGKVLLAFKFSLQAIWCRLRHGVKNLYYVPAFPARAPLYRDWIVLSLCRPFFSRVIYHWHAVGLGDWLATQVRPWERWFSRWVYAQPDLSVVLRPFNRTDGEQVASKRVEVVANGIPDPCPDFARDVLPRRLARVAARKKILAGETLSDSDRAGAGPDANVFQLLFVSMCYSGKGLFDTVEAVALVHQKLKGSPLRVKLIVAGAFWLPNERTEFEERIRQPDLQDAGQPIVEYRGFVSGADKQNLFAQGDCLCFPTCMAESFGLVLVEGMAFGLPLITTRWRNIPEMLPPNPSGIVAPKSPEQIAAAVVSYMDSDYHPALRAWFLDHYTDRQFCKNMKRVLASVDETHEPK